MRLFCAVSQETQPSISTAHNITRLYGIEHKGFAAPGISVRCRTPFDHSNETGAQLVRIEQENEENVSRVPRRRNGASAKGVHGPAVEYDPSLAPFETQGRQEAAQALRFASRFSGQAGREGGDPLGAKSRSLGLWRWDDSVGGRHPKRRGNGRRAEGPATTLKTKKAKSRSLVTTFPVMSPKTTAKGPRARDGKALRGALGYKGCAAQPPPRRPAAAR
jgi:hypothetical protein